MSSTSPTYVITLQLDAASFEWLQQLRTRHFPPQRNVLPAHLTLLHTASPEQIDSLKQARARFEHLDAPSLRFTGVRFLGGGTAVVVQTPPLDAIRADMMGAMGGSFSRQDLQPFKAHVTVQNKVSQEVAKSLYDHLSTTFTAREGWGEGLMIWHYRGGPWSLDSVLSFRKAP